MSLSPERALISAVLRTQSFVELAEHMITEDYFNGYCDEAKWLFRYFTMNHRVPSKTTFRAEFPDFRVLAVDDVDHYCEAVRHQHARAMLTETLSNAAEALRSDDLDKAIKIAHSGIVATAARAKMAHDTDIIDNWEQIYLETKDRKKRFDETGFAGIPTGFETIDERTGGLQPGQFIVLGARLGEGKSWSLLRMATTAVMAGKTVQFDALEMTRTEVSYRMHAFLSSSVGRNIFSNTNLAQGKEIDLVQYKQFLRNLRSNLSGKLHVADSSRGRIGILDIQAQLERNKPDIIFIDYITLMAMKGEGDWSSIAKLTNELKQIASAYHIPVVVASQLNRNAVGGKEPGGPEDMSRGDSVGQDADGVYTQRLMSPRALMMKCGKNRHGVGGFKLYCHFEPTRGIFQEIPYEAWQDLKTEDSIDS